ncbi:MAG: holo-ACP synthase [Candidatus Omnitrophica bacterium]|nr:holo-ACP synthase [Candidatus Omnitrophota bacterium]
MARQWERRQYGNMAVIGNGVDIIEVRRIAEALEKYGQDFLQRILTDKEIEEAQKHATFHEHIAGRFAAKEAVFKALSNERLTFLDIEISNENNGKPICSLRNNKGGKDILLSISHVKNYAVASAIVIQKTD